MIEYTKRSPISKSISPYLMMIFFRKPQTINDCYLKWTLMIN